MSDISLRKYLLLAAAVVLAYPLVSSLLPIALPLLLSVALAGASQPSIRFLERHVTKNRALTVGLGVTGVLLLTAGILFLLSTILVRQLSHLTELLPTLTEAVTQGTLLLKNWLLGLAQKAPAELQPPINNTIINLLSSGTGLLEQAVGTLPKLAGNFLWHLSDGLVGFVTILLATYMIAARWPQLTLWFSNHTSAPWRERLFAATKGLRRSMLGWIVAQLKLAGICFALLLSGFLLLKIPYALLWAALTTLVDSLPILGAGTVLVPWSIVSLLQGNTPKALGLLGIFAVTWLVRSLLSPKLVSKELGLDSLATLLAIYAGFRLWGFWGLVLAPVALIGLLQFWRQLRR